MVIGVALAGLLISAGPVEVRAQPSLVTDAFTGLIDVSTETVTYTHGTTTELCFGARESFDGADGLFCYDGTTVRQVSGTVSDFGNLSAQEDAFVVYDGVLYFGATGDKGEGKELWSYDGTSVTQVDDINAGAGGSDPANFAVYDQALYFSADGGGGTELWRYRSGDAGATKVDDLCSTCTFGGSPSSLTVYDGALYFRADDATDGYELWSYTAGDASATQVDDINGGGDSIPSWLTVYDGSLYFAAYNGTDGTELWSYTAGDASATQVDDINGSGSSSPNELTVYDGTLYFQAYGDSDGTELWSYTAGNTSASKVDDVYDGSSSSVPRSFTVYDGALYFRARVETGPSITRRNLFRYATGDGSATNVADINYDNSVNVENGMTVYDPGSGPKLYFDASQPTGAFGNGEGLYSYDGPNATLSAEANTNVSTLTNPTSLTALNGSIYFFASTSATSGVGLWAYSGGTVSLVKDSFTFGSLSEIAVYDGALYFRAEDFTSGSGVELWTSDGTTSGTEMVEDLNSGSDDGVPRFLTVYDGNLYFSANNGSTGSELYLYDGSSIKLVENICSSCYYGSRPQDLTVYDNSIYFSAEKDDGAGRELYRSNGLSATRVTDINPGSGYSSPTELTVWDGRLYFQATDGSTGRELFVYDAAQDQAQLVKNIDGGSGNSNPSNLTVYDNRLFFQATDGNTGQELFKLDGPIVSNVADLNAGGKDSDPRDFAVYNDRLYFTAYTEEDGREPHGYDGSSVTSVDLNAGSASGGGVSPIRFDDGSGVQLYVLASDGQTGTELWRFDQNSAPLPVELASFEAARDGRESATLSWTTASEQNNAGFRVQHKAPSQDSWSRIGFVESKATGGTTTDATTYQFSAEDLSVGAHQFRLKQVDLEGTTHLHASVELELTMKQALRVSGPAPNPVRNQATVSFAVKERKEVTLTLYNLLGQKVRTLYRDVPAPGQAQRTPLDASTLSSGTYFLRLQADGKTKTRRVTVVQ